MAKITFIGTTTLGSRMRKMQPCTNLCRAHEREIDTNAGDVPVCRRTSSRWLWSRDHRAEGTEPPTLHRLHLLEKQNEV
jgi:hypothetical protein